MLSTQRGFVRAGAFIAKVLTVVFVSFLFSCVLQTKAMVARADIVDTDTSKAVAVAFDNSGSMSDRTDRWCTAKYGLEILAAMMGSQDVLHVVPMPTIDGRNTEFVVEGAWPAADRVSKVHNADLGNALQTDPYTAQAALEKLRGVQADEKFLVIVTDGKFANMGELSGIQIVNGVASQAVAEGTQVIYLAIGSEVDLIEEGDGISIEQSGAGTEILETMKTVAEKIYGRARLNDAYDASNGKLELTAPMGTIIVLAQGEGASVGKLTAKDGTSYTPDVATARYSEHPYVRLDDKEWAETNATYYDTAQVNKDLVGQVGVFSEHLPAGTYQLEAQGSNIEVYYKPNVEISMVLLGQDGSSIDLADLGESGFVPEGSYSASYRMLDPDTGEVVNSSLLEGGSLSVDVTYDGQTSSFVAGDTIVLNAGRPSVTATVELPSNVRVSEKYGSIRVMADVVPLSIETSDLDKSINVNTLDSEGFSAQLRIAKTNGEAITKEEWDQMDISARSDADVSWTVTKSDTIGEAKAQLELKNKTAAELSEELLGWPHLPFVPSPIRLPSCEVETSFTAMVSDELHPSSGGLKKQAVFATPMSEVIIRAAIVISILAFILWAIWFFGTWPKLPKGLAPVLVMPTGYQGTNPIRFSKGSSKRKLVQEKGRLLPRRTTIMHFGPSFSAGRGNMSSFIQGTVFEIRAVKPEKGERRFMLSEHTMETLEKMQGTDQLCPPDWKFNRKHPYSINSNGPSGTGIDPRNNSHTATYSIKFK